MKFRSIACGVLLGAALSGPSTAAVYTGIWDPQFGAPFATDFFWRGDASYLVPDFCIPVGPGLTIVPNSACSLGAIVTSATVRLYDNNGFDDASAPALLATLTFNPSSMPVANLHFLDGELVQLETGISTVPISEVVEPGVNLGDYGAAGTSFFLSFSSIGPRLHFFRCLPSKDCDSGVNDAEAFPPDFTITRVPEPATFALAGLAVAGLAASRRRRRNTAG